MEKVDGIWNSKCTAPPKASEESSNKKLSISLLPKKALCRRHHFSSYLSRLQDFLCFQLLKTKKLEIYWMRSSILWNWTSFLTIVNTLGSSRIKWSTEIPANCKICCFSTVRKRWKCFGKHQCNYRTRANNRSKGAHRSLLLLNILWNWF